MIYFRAHLCRTGIPACLFLSDLADLKDPSTGQTGMSGLLFVSQQVDIIDNTHYC
jgi:hypothetical protein